MIKKSALIIIITVFIIICCIGTVAIIIIKSQSIIIGSGVNKNETRNIANFKNIIIEGDFQVRISESQDEGIEINSDDNIVSKIITKVDGDDLNVYLDRPFPLFSYDIQKTKPISVLIKYKKINLIKLNGSGSINTESDKVRTDNLKIILNGSGTINESIFVDNLNLISNGSGTIILNGAAKTQNINMSGSSQLDAKNLESKETTVQLNGSGGIVIRADDKLQININGSGTVNYYGTPKNFNQNINGSGLVKQIQ